MGLVCFFLFFCFLFIINERTWNVQHWILVWIKIAMTSRQNSRPIIGNWMGEKWRVIIYFRKGSVNCRQNFNVKNNILLEANLYFMDWNSNERILWKAMDQDVTVGWHVRSHSVCFHLIAFENKVDRQVRSHFPCCLLTFATCVWNF